MINYRTIELMNSSYTSTQASSILDIRKNLGAAAACVWTDATPSAKAFTGGTIDVKTITFDTKANTTHGDYVVIRDTNGAAWAVAASKAGIAEVTDITAIAEGSVKEITAVTALAEGSVKEVTQVTTVADVSASLAGTYFKVYDASGSVGVWFSTGGVPGSAPTGAAACDRDVEVSFTEDDTDTTIAGLITTAFVADGGLSVGNVGAVVTITDLAYGTRTNATDGGAGDATGFTIETTVEGAASALDGKYFILQDEVGSVAFWIDVDDSGTSAPSHGADRAVEITTIASEDDLATVGTAIYTAVVADSKFEAGVDNADGSFTVRSTTYGVKSAASAGDSGFNVSESVAGVDSSLDGKYFVLQDVNGSVAFWIDVDDSGTSAPSHGADRAVEITTVTSAMTAAQVAGVVATAVNADSKFGATASDTVVTVTNVDLKALTDAADGDTGFSFETTTQGADLGAEPTGAIWAAIGAAYKTQADISADTTAANVAARFELAFDGLTGFTAVVTSDDTAADGTMLMTQVNAGAVTDASYKNADDSGAGSISVANTTPGVNSDINLTTNAITETAHGFTTGLVGQASTDGVLPAGLAAITNYYVIAVDANTYKLAASLADALAGTAVDITDRGSDGGTHTFTPTGISGSVKLQASLDRSTWFDITGKSSNITGSSSALHEISNAYYNYIRAYLTVTAGNITISVNVATKEA